jgi:hypothetical protein
MTAAVGSAVSILGATGRIIKRPVAESKIFFIRHLKRNFWLESLEVQEVFQNGKYRK